MVKKKKMKVAFAAFAGVMFFGGLAFSPNKSQAAKKVSITKSVKVYEGKNEKPSVFVSGGDLCSAVSCGKRAGCRDGHGGIQLCAYRQGNGAVRGLDVAADLWTLLV